MDGSEIELKQEILDSLRIRLKGQVLTSGDVGYDESRTVWNALTTFSQGN